MSDDSESAFSSEASRTRGLQVWGLTGIVHLNKTNAVASCDIDDRICSFIGFCLLLMEPEGGDFLADGVDVSGGDGAHDDEAHEDGHADARTANAEGAYHVHIG